MASLLTVLTTAAVVGVLLTAGSAAPDGAGSGLESKRLSLGDSLPTTITREQNLSGGFHLQGNRTRGRKPSLVPEIWKEMFAQDSWDSMEVDEIWKNVRSDPKWETVCPTAIWKSLLCDPALLSTPLSVISKFILDDPYPNISGNPESLSLFSSFSNKGDSEESTMDRYYEFPSFLRPPWSWFGYKPFTPQPNTVRYFRYNYGTNPPFDLHRPDELMRKAMSEVQPKVATSPNNYGMRWNTYYATSNYGGNENDRSSVRRE